MLDCKEVHGCMQLIKYGHLSGNVATHTNCAGDTWYTDLCKTVIEKELLDEKMRMEDLMVTCEVNEGSVLFLNNLIPHCSLDNFSEQVRWSLDLRWQNNGNVCGFEPSRYPLKIRDKRDKDYKCKWEEWSNANRLKYIRDQVQDDLKASLKQSFDPHIGGPWMEQWELVNENGHTQWYFDNKAAEHDN